MHAVRNMVLLSAVLGCPGLSSVLRAQAPATVPAPANRIQGTVKSVTGSTLVVVADGGQTTTVIIGPTARVQQSADLKTVSASSLDQIAVGDRVLAIGTPGDAGSFTASRLIMIKSEALAQRNQASQADWARRGTGGIVTAIDPAANTISVTSGARKITIDTTKSTIYRSYAPGSVKFEEAIPSTLAQIHPGDQVRVRGDRSPDGSTITAEEIVSGTFKNLSGTVVSVNAAANTFVIKDLVTKRNETVTVGNESDLRAMPPEMASRFAPHSRSGGAAAGQGSASDVGPSTGNSASRANTNISSSPSVQTGSGGARRSGGYGGADGGGSGNAAPGGSQSGAGPGSAAQGGGPGRSASGGRTPGGDLSQMIPRMPKTSLADLKTGQALMIVASGNGNGPYTAITVLSGVEPLLTGPAGSEPSLSPWSLGGGAATE